MKNEIVVMCPPWATPVPRGILPETEGWYLAVDKLMPTPVVEIVELELLSDGAFIVFSVGDNGTSMREDYHWIGRLTLPQLGQPSDADIEFARTLYARWRADPDEDGLTHQAVICLQRAEYHENQAAARRLNEGSPDIGAQLAREEHLRRFELELANLARHIQQA